MLSHPLSPQPFMRSPPVTGAKAYFISHVYTNPGSFSDSFLVRHLNIETLLKLGLRCPSLLTLYAPLVPYTCFLLKPHIKICSSEFLNPSLWKHAWMSTSLVHKRHIPFQIALLISHILFTESSPQVFLMYSRRPEEGTR